MSNTAIQVELSDADVVAQERHNLRRMASGKALTGVALIMVSLFLFDAYLRAERQRKAMEEMPVEEVFVPSAAQLVELVEELYNAGFKCYGSTACPATVLQRDLFGSRNSKSRALFERSLYAECRSAEDCPGIEALPTWRSTRPGFEPMEFVGRRNYNQVVAMVREATEARPKEIEKVTITQLPDEPVAASVVASPETLQDLLRAQQELAAKVKSMQAASQELSASNGTADNMRGLVALGDYPLDAPVLQETASMLGPMKERWLQAAEAGQQPRAAMETNNKEKHAQFNAQFAQIQARAEEVRSLFSGTQNIATAVAGMSNSADPYRM